MATRHPLLIRLALLALCAAYVQWPLTKLADWPGALAEMEQFGFQPAVLFAAGVIAFELVALAMDVTGIGRRHAAVALAAFTCAATLLALRFWELPPGPARSMAANAFFEHLGIAGAFAFVALREPDHPPRGAPA